MASYENGSETKSNTTWDTDELLSRVLESGYEVRVAYDRLVLRDAPEYQVTDAESRLRSLIWSLIKGREIAVAADIGFSEGEACYLDFPPEAAQLQAASSAHNAAKTATRRRHSKKVTKRSAARRER